MPHPHWMRAFLFLPFYQKSRFNTVKGIFLTAAKQSSMENSKHANKNGGNVRDFCYFLANQCGTTGENR